MELVWILRALSRRRVAVICGAAVALVLAVAGVYRVSLFPPALHSRAVASGYAQEHILVDTPHSLLTEARPNGNASVVTKATVLGAALTGEEARAAIARSIGRPARELEITTAAEAVPQVPSYLALAALKASVHPAPYTVKIGQGYGLPILSITGTAPTRAAAQRLVSATSAALSLVAKRVLATGRGVKLEAVGQPSAETVVTVPGRAKPVGLAFALWLAWCIAVLFYDRLARRTRRRRPASGLGPIGRVLRRPA